MKKITVVKSSRFDANQQLPIRACPYVIEDFTSAPQAPQK